MGYAFRIETSAPDHFPWTRERPSVVPDRSVTRPSTGLPPRRISASQREACVRPRRATASDAREETLTPLRWDRAQCCARLARAVEAVSLEERLELAVREEDEVVALLLGAELDRGVQLRRGHRQVDWAGVSRRNRLAAAEDDVLKAAPLAKLSQHLADLAAAHNHRRLVLSRLDLRLSEKEVEILLRGAAVRVDLQSRQPRARAASSGWR